MSENQNALVFDESNHSYKLNGYLLPSVTQIMKPLSSVEYKDVDNDVLMKAAERGTAVHEAIEYKIKYDFDDCPAQYEEYYNAFLKFAQDYSPKWINSEMRIYHRQLMYAGTVDLICEIDGEKVIVDFKTSSKINHMLTGVQLEAYAQALNSAGIDIDYKAILHLRKDGKYSFERYEKNDSESWNCFGALLTVEQYIKKHQ